MGHSKKMVMKSATYKEHTTTMRCGKILKATTEKQVSMLEKLHRKKCGMCEKGIITREENLQIVNSEK